MTAYPALKNHFSGIYIEANVVVDEDHRLITSRGVGTALDFALTLVERLGHKTLRTQLANAMVVTQ